MQILIDFVNSLRGRYWFSEAPILLFFTLMYLYQKISETEKFLRWRIKIQPDNSDAHLKLGMLLTNDVKQYSEAEIELHKAISLMPSLSQGYYSLYALYVSQEKHTEAFALISQMLTLFPNDGLAHFLYSSILWFQEEYENAERSYIKAISLSPNSYIVYAGFGRFLVSQDRFEEAINMFLKAIKTGAYEFEVYLKLATAYEKIRNFQEAERTYLCVIRNWPNELEAYKRIGFMLFEQKKNKEAVKVLTKGLPYLKDSVDLFQSIIRELVAIEKFKEAEDCARNFMKTAPRRPEPFANMAWVLFKQDRKDEALNLCRQAIELDSNYAYAHSLSAEIYIQKKQYNKAGGCYRKLVEIDKDDFDSHYNLGLLCHVYLNNLDEAEVLYKESLAINPDFFPIYKYLGDLYNTQHRYLEAEKAYRRARQLDKTNNGVKYQLSKVLVELNLYNEAIETLLDILEHDDKYSMAYLELAFIQRVKGNLLEARRYAKLVDSLIVEGDEDYWYNLACIESISGNDDLALDQLEHAKKENSFDKAWAWEDPDLQWIREDPRFVEIVGPRPEK